MKRSPTRHRLPLGPCVMLVAAAACGEQNAWVIRGQTRTAAVASAGSAGTSPEPETGGTGAVVSSTGGVAPTGGAPEETGGSGGTPIATGGTAGGTGGSTGGAPPETGGVPPVTGGSPSTGGRFEPVIDELVGFAASADGGGDTPPVTVTTCEELLAALEEPDVRRVVQIPEGTILDCPEEQDPVAVCEVPCPEGTGVEHILASEEQPCDTLGYVETTLPRTERRIAVGWNKTLLGLGTGATLQNVWLYLKQSSNIIIRNLVIENVNPMINEAGDGVTLEDSRDIWIDHCTFRSISDGFVDVLRGTATLSWNRFVGMPDERCLGQHPHAIDVNDSQVTLHHNWFWNTASSNPALDDASTFGHLFNNYYSGVGTNCVVVGNQAQARLESNVFLDSANPHSSTGDSQIEAISNLYSSSDGLQDNNATGLAVTYQYTVDPVDYVEDTVTQYAGPTAELGL